MAQREEEQGNPLDIVQLQLKANKAFCSIDGRGNQAHIHESTPAGSQHVYKTLFMCANVAFTREQTQSRETHRKRRNERGEE